MRIAVIVGMLFTTPVIAQDMTLIEGGQMIGMMRACGLVLDDQATLAFLASRVDPNEPTYSVQIASAIGLGEFQLNGMDDLSKRATCDAMEKHVVAFGLLKK